MGRPELHQPSAEFKNEWSFTFAFSYVFMAECLLRELKLVWFCFLLVEVDFFKPEVIITYHRTGPRGQGNFTIRGQQLDSCDFGLCE
jgi:hypothetical protein